MRGPVCFLALCLAAESALAQAVEPPNTITLPPSSPLAKSLPSSGAKSADDIKQIKETVAAWLKTCLTDWDAETHMTRKEWRTTCERVAAERGKFLLEKPPDSLSLYRKVPPR
jgi:hypothetical protein